MTNEEYKSYWKRIEESKVEDCPLCPDYSKMYCRDCMQREHYNQCRPSTFDAFIVCDHPNKYKRPTINE